MSTETGERNHFKPAFASSMRESSSEFSFAEIAFFKKNGADNRPVFRIEERFVESVK